MIMRIFWTRGSSHLNWLENPRAGQKQRLFKQGTDKKTVWCRLRSTFSSFPDVWCPHKYEVPRLPGSRDHVGWLDLNQPIRGQHPPSLTNERAESWILRVTHINGPGPGSQVQGQVILPRVAPCRPGPCSPSCKSFLPRGRPDTNWTLGSNPGFKSNKLKPSSHYWHTQVLRKKDWRWNLRL